MKILKDSVIYLIGELISKSIPFLLLPYLSRKLGSEGYGLLSYYQTYLALFVILIGLSQDGAVARYFYFYGRRSLNLIINVSYAYSILSGCIILLICLILQSEILAYLAISAVFQSFLSVQLSLRQCQKKAISYTLIQLLTGVLSAILTIFFMEYYENDLVEKRILAILVSNLVVFLIACINYGNGLNRNISIRRYKLAFLYGLGFGVPLLLHHLSFFLKNQVDRIFIYHRFTESDLGLYAMGAQLASIFSIVIMAINKATLPYLYESLKKKSISLKDIHKWALFSIVLVPILFFGMSVIPEDFIIWILGNQFIGTKYYFILFLVSITLLIPYLFLVNYLFFYGENKLISFCSVLSTIVYLICLSLFILTEIKYVPYASIFASIIIIPILYFVTKKVGKKHSYNE